MKNFIIVFIALFLSFSAVLAPWNASADGGTTTNYQTTSTTTGGNQSTTTASVEAKLISAQKELVVLLNRQLALLQAEYRTMLEGRLRGLQLQLLGLLQQQLTILRAQANNR